MAQLVAVVLVLYIWYSLNGGFIPKFLIPRMPYFKFGPEVGCLVYFDVNDDASKIRWARETNNLQDVKSAVADAKLHMIAGDVILRGHGTKSQALIPVMAKPHLTDSKMTLKNWLHEIKFGNKGIKLHFHSMESVEISLQILNDFDKMYPIKFPVWLHADILQGPHGDKPVIDYHRLFGIMKRLFPKCTLSLGWTTGTHTDLSQSAYTWDMVWDMLNIVQEAELTDQLIVFQARLSLIHNSVPQLKWLTDNLKHASVMIMHEDGDSVVNEEIMYVAYRFPPDRVYFDLNHDRFQALLDQYRHFSRDRVSHLVLARDEVMIKPDAWLKMGFHKQKNSILASTEAIILTASIVHIVSKSTYAPTPEISIQGRVQFFNRNHKEAEDYHTGINIYVRPMDYGHFDNIVAIRCFIGVGGEIEVTGSNLQEKISSFRKTARVTPTSANCYRFRITDEKTHITFAVKSQHGCTTLESVQEEEELVGLLTVPLPSGLEVDKQHPFVIKLEDSKRQVLIDELSIKHKN
jgi:hypothetical protein